MKKMGFALAVVATLGMSACGSAIPDMTEEQNAMIVEYAAGLLLKYDKNFHGRLVDTSDLEEEGMEAELQPEEEAPAEEPQPEEGEAASEEPEVVDVSEEPEEIVYHNIEEFFGISGINFQYTGYELKDMYPDNNTEEMFFAMNASEGCKLIILHFNATNNAGQDQSLDMLSINGKFKLSFNGESPRYALTTMLENDLASYSGSIAAGETQDLVLVAELQEEKAQSIQSISLLMRNAEEEAELPLN